MSILEVSNLKKVYVQRFRRKPRSGAFQCYLFRRGRRICGDHGGIRIRVRRRCSTFWRLLTTRPTGDRDIGLENRDVSRISEKESVPRSGRDNLGFVFQEFNLLDTFSLQG